MSNLNGKVVITAALNGARLHRGACPTVPYSTAELALEAQRAANAGAAIVHLCPRDPGGAPAFRVEACQEAVVAIRSRCDAQISLTTVSHGTSLGDRATAIDARPDRTLIALGSTTVARFNRNTRQLDFDAVDGGTFADAAQLLERARAVGVHPVLLCHDLGQVEALEAFQQMGLLTEPPEVHLALGTVGGASSAMRNIVHLEASLPATTIWHASALGESSWRTLGAVLAAGGHIRVGLEDERRLPAGDIPESSALLVEAAVRLVRAFGLEVASADDLRAS